MRMRRAVFIITLAVAASALTAALTPAPQARVQACKDTSCRGPGDCGFSASKSCTLGIDGCRTDDCLQRAPRP